MDVRLSPCMTVYLPGADEALEEVEEEKRLMTCPGSMEAGFVI